MAKQTSLDWALHIRMCFSILTNDLYLKNRGLTFELKDGFIHRSGGWRHSPSEIRSFEDCLSVMQNNGCAGSPRWEAIALLTGVSWHKNLKSGKEFLSNPLNFKEAA
jgi:hypothetical protein